MNSIQAAIEQAKSQAGDLAQNLPTIDMAPVPGSGAVTTYAQAAPATLDGFLDAGTALKVDHWLRTEASGFYVKGHDIALDDIEQIGLALPGDMQPFYGIRINIGGKATYYKTVDRISCVKTGKPWGQLLAEAAQQGQREYKGFDVRFTALSDLKDLKNKVVVTAGQTLGYSTSITNFADLADFARKVREQGLFGTDLVLKIKCEKRTNDKNPSGWGALIVESFAPFAAA